jgi:FixJ family two-component response regulator
MTGLEVFRALTDRQSPLVVSFLSGHGTIPDVVSAMQDGAVSWLQKSGSDEVLMSTVQAAKDKAMGIAAGRKATQAFLVRWSKLTDREKEVAPLVAQGKSAKLMAQLLTKKDPTHPIVDRTIEGYRARIFAKMEVANANELQKLMDENMPD